MDLINTAAQGANRLVRSMREPLADRNSGIHQQQKRPPPKPSRDPPPPTAAAAQYSGCLGPPHWSLPATHATGDIESLQCWVIGAACTSFDHSDLKVDVSTDGEYDLRVLDVHESDDEERIGFKTSKASSKDEHDRLFQHGRREDGWERLLPFEVTSICEGDEAYCKEPALTLNANLSSWWHHVRSTVEREEDQEEQGAGIAPPEQQRVAIAHVDFNGFDYEYLKLCARHPPIRWCKPHWKQHAATLKYYEWCQQHEDNVADHDWDIRLPDQGKLVPAYIQLTSGACKWDSTNTCLWCWPEMVAQLDDTSIRGGFTDMQFVFKGQSIEYCCVSGRHGGFILHRSDLTCVRLVPDFRTNQIWTTEIIRGAEVTSSFRWMKFNTKNDGW